MGYDTLALWEAIKNCMINHTGDPTAQQIHELKWAMDLCYLSIRGTIQLEKIKETLVLVGLNPNKKLE